MKNCYTFFSAHLIVIVVLVSSFQLKAQLVVDTSISASVMMHDFFDGTCVEIDNVTYTGMNIATGFFDASQTNLGINAGFMLTSGSVFNAVGPNISPSTSTSLGSNGDPDLTLLSGYQTYDASVIEMDIIPSVDTLFFIYSFGSEEYSEWVGSPYNDVFAFYVSGPGITGVQNIALVPGNNDPVSVNSINCNLQNQSYYVCNDPMNYLCDATFNCPGASSQTTIEYDGFTVPLTASINVIPGETYHVKLAISDAGDGIYDSGILIGVESLCGDGQLKPIAEFLSQVNDQTASFINTSRYATGYQWDFGDNTYSTDKNPVHEYATPGLYNVSLTVQNYCCSDVMTEQLQIGTATSVQNLTDLSVNIFPNPTTGLVTVQLPNGQQGIVKILDYAGRELNRFNVSTKSTLDLSGYQKGMLFMEVIADGKVYIRKVEVK